MGDDDAYYSSDDIHPPNVVLVSSAGNTDNLGQELAYPLQSSSSGRGTHAMLCSPLSTAPNSPCRGVSYDDEDDEDTEEDEIRPEEIEELLQVPPSPIHHRGFKSSSKSNSKSGVRVTSGRKNGSTGAAGRSEAPFDEGKRVPPATTTANNIPSLPVVSPDSSSPVIKEDIDAYVEEGGDEGALPIVSQYNYQQQKTAASDGDVREEKKVDDSAVTPPRSPPVYANYLLQKPSNTTSEDPKINKAEDDSVPDDERVNVVAPGGDSDADDEDNPCNEPTPKTKALQSAEREVQEMERRVQQMLDKRRRSSLGSSTHNNNHDNTTTGDQAAQNTSDDLEGEPPSLSPRRSSANNSTLNSSRDVHTSLDSGCSSYYYDGSVMGSAGSSSTPNHAGLDPNTSGCSSGRRHLSIMMNHSQDDTDDVMERDMGMDPPYSSVDLFNASGAAVGAASPGTARDLTRDYFPRDAASNTSSPNKKSKPTTFANFTARFDHEAQNGSFAKAIDDTSRAFHQVSEDVANFLAIPTQQQQQQQQQPSATSFIRGAHLSPTSPSNNSDCTPQVGNLSPQKPGSRRQFGSSIGSAQENPVASHVDGMYQKRSSYNIEKARSLVQSRLSPTTVGLQAGEVGTASGSKERARQVVDKREREQHQRHSSSKASTSASLPRARTGSDSARNNDTKPNSSSSLNIPAPPSLFRIAAMVEGLGGSNANTDAAPLAKDGQAEDADWPSSVSQLMEEYQTAITESLRNLSMEEITGLAQNGGIKQPGGLTKHGIGTMSSPGVAISPTRKNADYGHGGEGEYDDMIAEMTMGACLAMPNLDHSPHVSSRSKSNVEHNKDYRKGTSGVLKYDEGVEFQYHDEEDGPSQVQADDDVSEHEERAAFATALSEKLLNLAPNACADTSDSFGCHESPEKSVRVVNASFDSNKDTSMLMSPPKRSKPGSSNKDSMNNIAESAGVGGGGGLFVSSMQHKNCLPSSEQSSVCSNGYSPEREKSAVKNTNGVNATSKLNESTGSGSILTKPTMVESIDNETGIAKGDLMLSLLCDNSFQASKENADSWAWRVREAIWRSRDMRKEIFGDQDLADDIDDDDGSLRMPRRASLPVDVDDVRVVGGIKSVASIQEKALAHLRDNKFEQSLELYEDIIFNYYSFFEEVLAKRDEFSSEDVTKELSNFKPYIGASLHNLGVIHLLKGDYEDAFSFFKRAVDNRRACLGEDHPECIVSQSSHCLLGSFC